MDLDTDLFSRTSFFYTTHLFIFFDDLRERILFESLYNEGKGGEIRRFRFMSNNEFESGII